MKISSESKVLKKIKLKMETGHFNFCGCAEFQEPREKDGVQGNSCHRIISWVPRES
jgi:hypothetical protein